jgi:hypothetical protein
VIEPVDHKVTSRRSTPDELADDFQLNLYGQHDATEMTSAELRVRDAVRAIPQDTQFVPVTSERCRHCPWQPSCDEGSAWVATHGA